MRVVEGMRPGRSDDLPSLTELWRDEVRAGTIDRVPGGLWLERLMQGLDWDARSRVIERAGRLEAAVLVLDRRMPAGTVVRLEFAGTAAHQDVLVGWGVRLARAAGAQAAQVWRPRGSPGALRELGFGVVRPFWRMDRADLEAIPKASLAPGYHMVTDQEQSIATATWATTYNLSFADHWQHAPKAVEEFERRRERPDYVPGLQVLALTDDGVAVGLVVSSLETYDEDRRPQPVGMVAIVGTVPGHRRQGLALALTSQALRRLRAAGARSASLYVDADNPTRAYDAYRKLGFEVAYEFEVWEVAFAV